MQSATFYFCQRYFTSVSAVLPDRILLLLYFTSVSDISHSNIIETVHLYLDPVLHCLDLLFFKHRIDQTRTSQVSWLAISSVMVWCMSLFSRVEWFSKAKFSFSKNQWDKNWYFLKCTVHKRTIAKKISNLKCLNIFLFSQNG